MTPSGGIGDTECLLEAIGHQLVFWRSASGTSAVPGRPPPDYQNLCAIALRIVR